MKHTYQKAAEYMQDVKKAEMYFRWALLTGNLIFYQWKSLRLAGEDVLVEQKRQQDIDALQRIGITDDFLTWMYEQGRCKESCEPDGDGYSRMLCFPVRAVDIGDFAKACLRWRQKQEEMQILPLFRRKQS